MPPSRNVYTFIPPVYKELVNQRLNELLESNIIERVTEEMDRSFCSSLLVVPKGKNDIRLVIDLRGPNQCIFRTPFKMPTLDSILMELHGSSWFSTIDLKSAFFHVELEESSRHLTNFFAGDSLYRYCRLPFGLCNAPDTFQEILQTIVLAGCKGAFNYIDDILVHGRTLQEHDENLKMVMACLKNHNVEINHEKCEIGKQSVTFLGFKLSKEGWSLEEDKIKSIQNFRKPQNQQEVKSFLGLINFVDKFIPHRASKTRLLRELANAECYYWNDELNVEFEFLKNFAWRGIKKLGYYNKEDNTELYVDASPYGLGGVLIQLNSNSVPRIIACASKSLTSAEKKYPHTQKEALAIVWAVERFSLYLLGKFFIVRSDAEANTFIFNSHHRIGKRAVTRAEGWALRLQPYDFKVEKVPGNKNVADVLSRLIDTASSDVIVESFDESFDKHLLHFLDVGKMEISWNEIAEESQMDVELIAVTSALESGNWQENLRRFECEKKHLRVFGGMVFKEDRIVLPSSLRERALKSAHEGHTGIASMKKILREYFWWPSMSVEAEKLVKKCETCLLISRKNPPIPLTSREMPQGPWEVLQIDFFSAPGFGRGEFLVVVDLYSRFLHVVEMGNTDADSTNQVLMKIFALWGLPLILQSDNGPPFQSTKFISVWEGKGVKVQKSLPLCPQTNGAVERQNSGIKNALTAAKLEGIDWKGALEKYIHLHNKVRPLTRLGVTPFELLVGWRFRGTFPCLWDKKTSLDREKVRERDAFTKLQSTKYTDQRRGAKVSDITVGDVVVLSQQKKSKTDATFGMEKFTVMARDNAEVVLRSDRGVQFSRNVGEVKRAIQNNSNVEASSQEEQFESGIEASEEINEPISPDEVQARPRRELRIPGKYKDMVLYSIFS
ncbi:uncharacterized protein K02A2.6-like [Uranotaenia lowii]|uniref:uncharacterized protein K02A2.6-like n=1 Tax=Uranotaenia lowii TaxID=190385 RepID=UPI002479A79D|nr:uncharacterized protein K02A2.6-like [Uranotaenia lowii]